MFHNDVRHVIFVARSDSTGPTGTFGAGERVTVRVGFTNWLAPSRYTLTPGVLSPDNLEVLERRPDYTALLVDTKRRTGGVADLPIEIEVRRP